MPIQVGTRLGPYEVVALLGAGGMGEVYRARDAKLGRDVALKIIPEAFASDPERLARFGREARTLASLNHPNIAQVHGFEESGPTHALVMELVEGATLADLKNVPLDQALHIARQIADALEAAHEVGIIHRDLKPANIKVRPDGAVKVLDFGLAKTMDAGPGRHGVGSAADPANSPTLTSAGMTVQGVILGTAAYMSPEQARGRPVDRRADIWAFGAVLYEMLAGHAAFSGDTITDIIASLVSREPEWTALPNDTPGAVRHLLRRCLEKDPKRRLRDIGEASIVLADSAASSGISSGAMAISGAPAPAAGKTGLRVGVAALTVALVIALALLWRVTETGDAAVLRLDVQAPPGTAFRIENRPALAISPDGTTFAFTVFGQGVPRLFVRRRDQGEARLLAGTEGASDPVFSPDGKWIAFVADAELKKVSLDGPVVSLAKVVDSRSASWIDQATIVYSPAADKGLFTIAASGGTPQELTKLDAAKGERTHRWPIALPGGKVVLFTVGTLASPDNYDLSPIDALTLANGERRTVIQGASFVRYSPTGHLLFARGGSIYAVKFDAERLAVSGDPVPVVQGVATDTTTGAAHFAIANDGTLIYLSGSTRSNERQLFWVSASGAPQPLPNLPPAIYNDLKISPDGRRAAVLAGPSGSGDIWVHDFDRRTATRLTFEGTNATPAWSADSRFVYYASVDAAQEKTTFFRKPADGSKEAEPVARLDVRGFIDDVDRRGESLLVDAYAGGNSDVVKITTGSESVATKLASTAANEYQAAISPDGRWLAHALDASGRNEIFVRDLAPSGGRWQVSTTGGEEPRWSSNGNELYFRNDTQLMAVTLEPGPQFRHGAPKIVVDGIYNLRSASGFSYDVDPKGGRFLMIRPADSSASDAITGLRVVLNWFTELRAKLK